MLFHIGTTNPNLSKGTDRVSHEGFVTKALVALGPIFSRCIVWSSTLHQAGYIYAQSGLSTSMSRLFSHETLQANLLALSSVSALGYILMIFGGLGRLWCYKTLGAFFTYEITIRSSHKLIQSGPYAYVRHPSYTFVCVMATGTFCIHRRVANFFLDIPWMQVLFGPLGLFICWTIILLFLRVRVAREEEELKKNFGKEWVEFASTRKRFVPGLI